MSVHHPGHGHRGARCISTGRCPYGGRKPCEHCVSTFTAEEIQECQDAMAKPAPREALALIASGRVLVEVTRDGRDVLIDKFDGRMVRDDDHPDCKMGLAGAWPLLRAGMIDQFGVVTEAGRRFLAGRPA